MSRPHPQPGTLQVLYYQRAGVSEPWVGGRITMVQAWLVFLSFLFFFLNESCSPLPSQNLIQRNCSAVTARVLPWLPGSTCGYGNRKLPVVSATSTLEGMEWPLIGVEAVRFLRGGGQSITFSGQMGISYPSSRNRKAAVPSSRHSAVCPQHQSPTSTHPALGSLPRPSAPPLPHVIPTTPMRGR